MTRVLNLAKLHWGHVQLIGRGSACLIAGFPLTWWVPLSLLGTQRFKHEDFLRRIHLMTPWARFCRKHILKYDLHIEGREHLPKPSRGFMYVSNHQSWIDILVLMEALESVTFLSKSLVKWIPVAGWSAYAAGTIFLDRHSSASRKKALSDTIRMCKQSTAVVVFPEGTRSATGQISDTIHPAILKAAYEHDIHVVPLALDGSYRVVPKTMDRIHLGERVAVSIGTPLDPKQFVDRDVWVHTIWEQVKRLFKDAMDHRHTKH